MSKIFVNDIELWGKHGVEAYEHEQTQKFIIDIDLDVDTKKSETSDLLADTVDYVPLSEIVRDIVENKEFALIERLGATIAQAILVAESKVSRAAVTVKKPMVLVNGVPGITITLNRADL